MEKLRIPFFRSLSFQLLLVFLFLTLLMLGTVGFALYSLSERTYDAKIINLSGRQRMLIEKITKAALGYLHLESLALPNTQKAALQKSYKKEMQKAIELWKKTQHALEMGGVLNSEPKRQWVIQSQKRESTRQTFLEINKLWKKFEAGLKQILKTRGDSNQLTFLKEFHRRESELLSQVDKLVKILETDSQKSLEKLSSVLYAICIAFTVLLGIYLFFVQKLFIRPLLQLANLAQTLSQGDLKQAEKMAKQVPLDWRSEMGILFRTLRQMVLTIKEVLQDVQDLSSQLAQSAQGVLSLSLSQASTVQEISASLTQNTSALQETSTSAKEVEERAKLVFESAKESASTAELAEQHVHAATMEIQQIRQQVEDIAQQILDLSEQTQRIGDITAIIEDLASQTNMLALNAAIEAARAGESGKGFAVVAQEVRKLAEQSSQAAKEIGSLIQEIQNATNQAVMATEQGTKGVEKGVQLIQAMGDSFQRIFESVRTVMERAQQIQLAAQQQTVAVEQITQGMSTIEQAMRDSAVQANQSKQSSEELTQMSEKLLEVIRRFQGADRR